MFVCLQKKSWNSNSHVYKLTLDRRKAQYKWLPSKNMFYVCEIASSNILIQYLIKVSDIKSLNVIPVSKNLQYFRQHSCKSYEPLQDINVLNFFSIKYLSVLFHQTGNTAILSCFFLNFGKHINLKKILSLFSWKKI